MGANVDDYYSSMASDESGENSSDKKKPVIKKKLIVRPKKIIVKKVVSEISEPSTNNETGETQKVESGEKPSGEATLNDALSGGAPKKS